MEWSPQIGFQTAALDARTVAFELGMFGDRGGGKTGVLLADYAMDVPIGKPWKGIIFRRTTDEFETLIERSKDMYYGLFGEKYAKFYEDNMIWKFSNGATLQFSHMFRDSDVDKFIGREYVFCGYDDLPQFASPAPYIKMLASMRTSYPNIPMRIRSTGNPGGPGIGWIKQRFRIDEKNPRASSGKLIVDPRSGLTRMFLLALYEENRIHQKNDPFYRKRLLMATDGDSQLERAWIHADFSSLFGQYFTIFNEDVHKADPVETLAPHDGKVPSNWKLEAWLDYGESRPTSFGLVATTPENVSYIIAEYYGVGEYASKHAAACEDMYRSCPYTSERKPSRVWADSQIWYTRAAANAAAMDRTVAAVFKNQADLNLVPSVKGPNSRVLGWRQLKELLAWEGGINGKLIRTPRLYYFPDCVNWEREIKDAVYATAGNRDDIDTGCSDHSLDGCRYWAMGAGKGYVPKQKQEPGALTFDDHVRRARLVRLGLANPNGFGAPITRPEQLWPAVTAV